MDGLRYGRHSEIMSLIPVPRCCEASQKYPAIAFAVDYEDDDSHKAPGVWTIARNEDLCSVQALRDRTYYQHRPAPKFCPYCGTALPTMVRKKPVPKNVCRVRDGGYYCATCKERLNACMCDPLSSAFEPASE